MGKLEERENRRKSVIGSMIERTETLSAVGAVAVAGQRKIES